MTLQSNFMLLSWLRALLRNRHTRVHSMREPCLPLVPVYTYNDWLFLRFRTLLPSSHNQLVAHLHQALDQSWAVISPWSELSFSSVWLHSNHTYRFQCDIDTVLLQWRSSSSLLLEQSFCCDTSMTAQYGTSTVFVAKRTGIRAFRYSA